jgi:competence protein ComEC
MSGVALRSFFDVGMVGLIAFVVLGICVAGVSFAWTEERTRLLAGALVLFSTALGVVRFDMAEVPLPGPDILAYLGQNVRIEGVIYDEPDVRENVTRLIVVADSIEGVELTEPEKILVSTARATLYAYGDHVVVEGNLQQPENFETDTGRVFDYISFLKKDDIQLQVSFAVVEQVGVGGGNPVVAFLFSLKHAFLHNVAAVIPDPEASLLGGVVVGAKESLGEDLMDQFRKTGIVHIVVLSGYNLSIVASAIMHVLQYVPRAVSLSAGGISIILFAIMTGGSATIVRAAIMALLVLVAQATGRTYDVIKALFITGCLMVLYSPYTLIFDPSFQLSFLATLGLILLSPWIEKYLTRVPEFLGLKGVLIATVATQIFVLPLLLFMSGTLSLVSIPVNLLVLVVVPLAMFFGFITGLVGFISSVLAYPFAFVTYGILHYVLFVVDMFGRFPYASITLPYFPWWLMLLSYVLLALCIWRFYVRQKS